MNGIYGICEPGVQLQPDELEPMALTTRLTDDQKELPIGGNGALLGIAHRSNGLSLGVGHGLLVAVDADLSNSSALLAENENVNGGSISSIGELVGVLYARYGLSFVERLEGAFSVALWDPKQQRLILAIDRFGFKTLYWSREPGRVLFSSRLGAVARMKRRTEIDPGALMQFLIHTVV